MYKSKFVEVKKIQFSALVIRNISMLWHNGLKMRINIVGKIYAIESLSVDNI